MSPQVDPSELLAAQRGLRDRLLGARALAAAGRPGRELAAEMLLYLDDVQRCWLAASRWLLDATQADRVDAGFCGAHDRVYRPGFESTRPDAVLPPVLGMPMNALQSGIDCVWASEHAVVFENIEFDRRLGPAIRQALLAAGTRRKVAVALRDGAHDVGLLCIDGTRAQEAWAADACEHLDRVAREVIGPVLHAIRRIGAAESMPADEGTRRSAFDRLTPAELKVARWVLSGASYKEIARRLDRSLSTVDHQLRSMREKLGVNSNAKLMRELVAIVPEPHPLSSSTRTGDS